MTVRKKLIQLVLFILLAGVMFILPYKLVEVLFNRPVPSITIWQALLLGNISQLGFAFLVGMVERITLPNEKEILNRR